MCVCVCVKTGSVKDSRMRQEILFSLPVEMAEEEEEECAAGGERCVCISVEEMESFFRYSQCCQQLLSESHGDECVCVCVSLWLV